MSNYTTLAQELRQRINPAYATQIGTESYERRLCAEAIEDLLAINAELLEALQASSHMAHTFPDGLPCICSQCKFVWLRDAAIAKAGGTT